MKTKWHARLSADIAPPVEGESPHWKLRDKHRRHVERMKSGATGARVTVAPDATRTMFLKSVREPADEKTLTKDGRHSSKTGGLVTKGRWRGLPIRTLTLEERATCPRACSHWQDCYGNVSPWSRRLVHGDDLEIRLFNEVSSLAARGPLVVRLHMLGDFYSEKYIDMWRVLIENFNVNVFGYTAHPAESPLGAKLAEMARTNWARFSMRFSGKYQPPTVKRAITVRSVDEAKALGAVVCPAQLGPVSCSTCTLCWNKNLPTVGFLQH